MKQNSKKNHFKKQIVSKENMQKMTTKGGGGGGGCNSNSLNLSLRIMNI